MLDGIPRDGAIADASGERSDLVPGRRLGFPNRTALRVLVSCEQKAIANGAKSTKLAAPNHERSAARNVFNPRHGFLRLPTLLSFDDEYISLSISGQGVCRLRHASCRMPMRPSEPRSTSPPSAAGRGQGLDRGRDERETEASIWTGRAHRFKK